MSLFTSCSPLKRIRRPAASRPAVNQSIRRLIDRVTICLPAGIDRGRELLFLPVYDLTTTIDEISGTVAQLLGLTTKDIAAFDCLAANRSARFRPGLRSENNSGSYTDSESEKKVRQALRIVHVVLPGTYGLTPLSE